MKRINIERLRELEEQGELEEFPELQKQKEFPELGEHDARIAKLMNELHDYALRHGYSDEDLYEAAYAFTVETLSLLSKRDAREILRKLEEGADVLRKLLKKLS